MGFRSNFITEMSYNEIPNWYREKYPDYTFHINKKTGKNVFPIAQLWESKFYDPIETDERFLDIQKVIKELNMTDIVIILLHECGGITRVKITHDSITAREPIDWKDVKEVEHSYCYGCSDKNDMTDKKSLQEIRDEEQSRMSS
jgi:hypothetical protein